MGLSEERTWPLQTAGEDSGPKGGIHCEKAVSETIPKGVLIDFVFSELKQLKWDNYLLEIKVYRKFSDFHLSKKGDIEAFYRKSPKKRPIEITRKEFKALLKVLKKDPDSFGLIGYYFAFKTEKLLNLTFAVTWGNRSDAMSYELKIVGERLKKIEDSLDIVWHL